MNREALYYKDIKEFDATVLSCENAGEHFRIVLDAEGFYPEGGGQPSDHGKIIGNGQEIEVLDVQIEKGKVVHYIDAPLDCGYVHCIIDWDRRMRNTQNHSGEHILSGLVNKKFGYNNVGFHMDTQSAQTKGAMTIDFDGVLTWNELMEIENQANAIVAQDRKVSVLWPSKEQLKDLHYRSKKELSGNVRLIEIDGADLCACCGTHVHTTGEIGMIKCLSIMNYKKGVRVEMVCGKDALEDYQKKHELLQRVSRMFSSNIDTLEEALQSQRREKEEREKKLGSLYREYFMLYKTSRKWVEGVYLILVENMEPVQIRQFCDFLLRETCAKTVIIGSKLSSQYSYVIGTKTGDAREIGKKLNAKLNGRGGGTKEMVQGAFLSTKEEVIKEVKAMDPMVHFEE